MKTINKTTYNEITAEEGFYLTSWQETDDILNYSGFKSSVCPLNKDLSVYREIPESEHISLLKEQEEYFNKNI